MPSNDSSENHSSGPSSIHSSNWGDIESESVTIIKETQAQTAVRVATASSSSSSVPRPRPLKRGLSPSRQTPLLSTQQSQSTPPSHPDQTNKRLKYGLSPPRCLVQATANPSEDKDLSGLGGGSPGRRSSPSKETSPSKEVQSLVHIAILADHSGQDPENGGEPDISTDQIHTDMVPKGSCLLEKDITADGCHRPDDNEQADEFSWGPGESGHTKELNQSKQSYPTKSSATSDSQESGRDVSVADPETGVPATAPSMLPKYEPFDADPLRYEIHRHKAEALTQFNEIVDTLNTVNEELQSIFADFLTQQYNQIEESIQSGHTQIAQQEEEQGRIQRQMARFLAAMQQAYAILDDGRSEDDVVQSMAISVSAVSDIEHSL